MSNGLKHRFLSFSSVLTLGYPQQKHSPAERGSRQKTEYVFLLVRAFIISPIKMVIFMIFMMEFGKRVLFVVVPTLFESKSKSAGCVFWHSQSGVLWKRRVNLPFCFHFKATSDSHLDVPGVGWRSVMIM